MTTTTHTTATLALLPERELDAIAATVVMPDYGVNSSKPQVFYDEDGFPMFYYKGFPNEFTPSVDLNDAALLEQALAERGLGSRYGDELMWNIGICPCGDAMCIVGGHDAFKAISASAKSRTIAAILAAQQEAK